MTDIFSIAPGLPFPYDALASKGLSEQQMKYHRDFHHQGYVTKLNAAAQTNAALGKKTIEELIMTEKGPVFNLAAQIWNHSFFWNSLSPAGGGEPSGRIGEEIKASFGSFEAFKTDFTNQAMSHFGSGWVWLVKDPKDTKLKIVQTHDAGCPITDGLKPILTLDAWEHAWYTDYGPAKAKYLEAWWRSVNWAHAETLTAQASKQ